MSRSARSRWNASDFEPKKLPRQPRAKATFDAIVDACARLLPVRGYAGVSTNHIAEAAGVGIASVYEYFPGKDAIVAQVAASLVARIVARLEKAIPEVLLAPPEEAARRWIELIYATIERERRLVAVFVDEVPYTNQLTSFRDVEPMLLDLSRSMRTQLGRRVRLDHEEASIYLMVTLTTSTILKLVLDPPKDIPKDEIIEVLSSRIGSWASGG